MGYSVDDMADTDFPFLHMAFDSTFVGLLNRVVTVHSRNMVEVETVVVGMVVAAVGPYTVAVDMATVELEIGVESSVVAVEPFVKMGYTAVVELETAVVPTIAAVGPYTVAVDMVTVELEIGVESSVVAVDPFVKMGYMVVVELGTVVVPTTAAVELHTVVVYMATVELEGVVVVEGPDAVAPWVAAGMVAVLELAPVVVDSAVVFTMPIVSVYLPALEYLGVAADSLAEPVLPLSDHVPALAVC